MKFAHFFPPINKVSEFPNLSYVKRKQFCFSITYSLEGNHSIHSHLSEEQLRNIFEINLHEGCFSNLFNLCSILNHLLTSTQTHGYLFCNLGYNVMLFNFFPAPLFNFLIIFLTSQSAPLSIENITNPFVLFWFLGYTR